MKILKKNLITGKSGEEYKITYSLKPKSINDIIKESKKNDVEKLNGDFPFNLNNVLIVGLYLGVSLTNDLVFNYSKSEILHTYKSIRTSDLKIFDIKFDYILFIEFISEEKLIKAKIDLQNKIDA